MYSRLVQGPAAHEGETAAARWRTEALETEPGVVGAFKRRVAGACRRWWRLGAGGTPPRQARASPQRKGSSVGSAAAGGGWRRPDVCTPHTLRPSAGFGGTCLACLPAAARLQLDGERSQVRAQPPPHSVFPVHFHWDHASLQARARLSS